MNLRMLALPSLLLLGLPLTLGLPLSQRHARAAEVTDLASAYPPREPFEARVSLSYGRRSYTGAVRRERVGRAEDQLRLEVAKELRFSQVEHVLAPRIAIGLWRDVQLHIELPVVVANSRSLDFEQNAGESCGDPPETHCVTPASSTIVSDGLVDGNAMDRGQVAVGNRNSPPGGLLLPERRGIDQLHIGVSWAPWNQTRDRNKPSWVDGFETRVAVGPAMTYDPTDPLADRGVGRRVHQFHLYTHMAKRMGMFEPWFGAYYLLPVADGSSLFRRTEFAQSGQRGAGPQHLTGARLGVEIISWERPRDKSKLTVELSTGLDATFGGRAYSPIWELLANNARLTGPCHPNPATARPMAEPEWSNGIYCSEPTEAIPHPGISRVDGYLTISGALAVNLRITPFAHLRLGLSLGHEQAHLITHDVLGKPRTRNAPIDAQDPLQINPMYRTLVDLPGKRFRVEDTTLFDLFASIKAMF